MNIITDQSSLQSIAETYIGEDETNYLKKVNGYIDMATRTKKSTASKMAWKRKRQHFMQGIRKYYGSSGPERTRARLQNTLKGLKASAKVITKISDVDRTKDDGREDDEDDRNEDYYTFPALPYQDFALVECLSEMIAGISESSRVFMLEDDYAARADIGSSLIEALSDTIKCVATRHVNEDNWVHVPMQTMEVIIALAATK